MGTLLHKKLLLISGLIMAIGIPGLAMADSRTKHSLKYQARDRIEHHDRGARRQQNYRHSERNRGHNRHNEGRHRSYYGGHRQSRHHGHRRHHYTQWDHRRYGHHNGGHYGHRRSGIRLNGFYLTPHLGLQINLGH